MSERYTQIPDATIRAYSRRKNDERQKAIRNWTNHWIKYEDPTTSEKAPPVKFREPKTDIERERFRKTFELSSRLIYSVRTDKGKREKHSVAELADIYGMDFSLLFVPELEDIGRNTQTRLCNTLIWSGKHSIYDLARLDFDRDDRVFKGVGVPLRKVLFDMRESAREELIKRAEESR